MKTVLIILAILLMLLAVGFYIVFRFAFRRGKCLDVTVAVPRFNAAQKDYLPEIERAAAAINNTPCEWVEITSHDGLTLRGRLFLTENADKVILLMHGYRSIAENDFSCGFAEYQKRGFHLLLPDERAHGRSEGTYITFGVEERKDCAGWADFLSRRFPEAPLYLGGISMGAASVLMATALPLPETVCGIIADCGFSAPRDIICTVTRYDLHLPEKLLFPLTNLCCRVFGRFSLTSCSAKEALKSCQLPVLFIHGEDDDFVPCRMSRENYDACAGEKYLVTVPGAIHGFSFMVDRQKVLRALDDFVEKTLPKGKAGTGDDI